MSCGRLRSARSCFTGSSMSRSQRLESAGSVSLRNCHESASQPKMLINEWLGRWLDRNVVWNPASRKAAIIPFSRYMRS